MKYKAEVSPDKRIRYSNVEALRIFSMFLIIAFHLCFYGGENIYTGTGVNSLIALLLGSWGTAGVGCFFLINGFYSWNNNKIFKSKKIVEIVFEVEFYVVVIYLFCGLYLHDVELSLEKLVREMAAPISMKYWYITVYILLYILRPFLKKYIQVLDKETYKKFLIVLSLIIPVYKFFVLAAPVDYLVYSIYLWMLGAYLGKYFIYRKYTTKIILSLITFMFLFIMGIFVINITTELNIELLLSRMRAIISPFQVMVAVCLFLLFDKLNIGYNKIINNIASTTLAVYLIHENPLMRTILFKKIFCINLYQENDFFVLYIIFVCIFIYLFSSLIDCLRKKIFLLLGKFIYRFMEPIYNKIDCYFS